MIPESIDSWQSRRSSKRGDPFCVVEKQGVDEHDDRLDMVICQCLKCCIEVIGHTDLGRDQLDVQLLTHALQFLPVNNCPAGDIHHEPDVDQAWYDLERKFDLLASQTFGAEQDACHVAPWP